MYRQWGHCSSVIGDQPLEVNALALGKIMDITIVDLGQQGHWHVSLTSPCTERFPAHIRHSFLTLRGVVVSCVVHITN